MRLKRDFLILFAIFHAAIESKPASANFCAAIKKHLLIWKVKAANPELIQLRRNPRNPNEFQFVLNSKKGVRHDPRNEFILRSGEENDYAAAFQDLKIRGYETIDLSDKTQLRIVFDTLFYRERLRKYQFIMEKFKSTIASNPRAVLIELLQKLDTLYSPNHPFVRSMKPVSRLTNDELNMINDIIEFDRSAGFSTMHNAKPPAEIPGSYVPLLSTSDGVGNLMALDRHRIEAAQHLRMPIVVEITDLATLN